MRASSSLAPYAAGSRLWLARFEGEEPLPRHLARHGHPIRYTYVDEQWPLADYQTAFAIHPAARRCRAPGDRSRPRSSPALWRRGFSSHRSRCTPACPRPSATSRPTRSASACPAATARLVDDVHESGGRVIAVGTTAVRALESAAARGRHRRRRRRLDRPGHRARSAACSPSTDSSPAGTSRRPRTCSCSRPPRARRCSDAPTTLPCNRGYLWHEFGDSHFVLP